MQKAFLYKVGANREPAFVKSVSVPDDVFTEISKNHRTDWLADITERYMTLAQAAIEATGVVELRECLAWLRDQMKAEQSIGVSGFDDWISPIDKALTQLAKGSE